MAVALGVGRVVPDLAGSVETWPYVTAGVGFALWGIVAIAYGTQRQIAIEKALQRGEFLLAPRWPLAALTLTGLALGLLTALLILLD